MSATRSAPDVRAARSSSTRWPTRTRAPCTTASSSPAPTRTRSAAGAQFADYHMLRLYFENPSPLGTGVVWTPAQWAPSRAALTRSTRSSPTRGSSRAPMNPVGACVPVEQGLRPADQPGGVRCSILDSMINVLGPRPGVGGPPGKRAGHGFGGSRSATRASSTASGTQQGLITAAQFVDLNATIGGARHRPQPDAGAARRRRPRGRQRLPQRPDQRDDNITGVAIVDHAGPDPGAAHDYAHTWWIRDRIDRAQGHTATRSSGSGRRR